MPKYSVQVLGKIPGDAGAFAAGINNAGEVAGSVETLYGTNLNCQMGCAAVWHGAIPSLLTVPGQFNYSEAAGINDAGQIAGTASFAVPNNFNRFSTAVVWTNGTPTLLNTPAPQYIYNQAAGINDAGQVAGWAYDGFVTVPVRWDGVTPTLLNLPPGGNYGIAYGINASGLVVGAVGFSYPQYSVNKLNAVVWRGSTPTLLQSPNSEGQAYAINDVGLIIGANSASSGYLFIASAWVNGHDTALGQFEAVQSNYALGANNRGMIVGKATVDNAQLFRAVLWSSTTASPQDLNHLISATASKAYVLTEAVAINDKCTIVANGHTLEGGPTVFVLTLNYPSLCVDGGIN